MNAIGLELNEISVKWAEVCLRKKTLQITRLQEGTIEDVKQLYLSDYPIISGLDAKEVLFKELEFPTHEKGKIKKLLPFQMESQIPYPIEEAVIATRLESYPKEKKGKAYTFSARLGVVQDHLEKHLQKQIPVSQVSCSPAALCRFSKFFFPKLDESILLHIADKTSTVLCVKRENLVFSHTFSTSFQKFSKERNSEEVLSQIKKELDRIFSFLESKGSFSCGNLILTADVALSAEWIDFLASEIPDTLTILSTPSYQGYDGSTLQSYAIPIGLALEGMLEDQRSIGFCKGSFSTSSIKEKKKRQLFSFGKSALALASVLFLLGGLYLEQRKHRLIKNVTVLSSKDALHTLEALEEEIGLLEEKEKKDQKNYSLVLPISNVSELLAFLSTHPSLSSKEIEISKVHYELVKHPKMGAVKAPYIGKVDIELQAKNPKAASIFYEKFCQNNPILHPKKDISWEEKGSCYNLCFFLKPYKGVSQ